MLNAIDDLAARQKTKPAPVGGLFGAQTPAAAQPKPVPAAPAPAMTPRPVSASPTTVPPATAPAPTAPAPPATGGPLKIGDAVPGVLGGSVSPGAAPGTPPAGYNDLRSQVYTPTASFGAQSAANMTDGVAGRLLNYQQPGFEGIAGGSYTPGQDTTSARSQLMQQLTASGSAPDRGALAGSVFDRLVRDSEPQYQSDLRAVGQKNAALGRIGSGMVTSQLADVSDSREKALASARGTLADSAAGLSLADRLAQLQATSGIVGQLGGEDRSNASVDMGLRNEARDERGAVANNAQQGFANQSGLLSQFSNLEGQRFGQDLTGRNEMRTERDRQDSLAQQGITNASNQVAQQDQLQNSALQRYLSSLSTFGGLGYSGNPASTLMGGANGYSEQGGAGAQSFADILAQYAAQAQLQRPAQN